MPAGAELDRATVVTLLSRVLADDPDFPGAATGEYLETELVGDRLTTDWYLHPGRTGLKSVRVTVWDNFRMRPAAPFRAELVPVLELLRELAVATGGRFMVEGTDVTDVPLGRVLDMIAPDQAPVVPDGAVLVRTTETDEEFLRRYVAAGEERLALLRGAVPGLDLSRDSLVALWGWAIDRLRPRDPGTPLERVMLENGSFFQRPKNATLPMWYGRSAQVTPHVWSDESLALIDAIVFYAAEAVRAAVPELTWQIARKDTPGGGNMHIAQPVLAGRGDVIAPITALMPLLGKVYYKIKPDKPYPAPAAQDLRDWYDQAVAERR
jgi:hypothetical protein